MVGNDCLFAAGVLMSTTDNHPIYDLTSGERLNTAGDIIIGNHVWFCMNAKIFNHSSIPDGCVIGAVSLVNKKFNKPNCLIAGVPAKIVRENIKWESSF